MKVFLISHVADIDGLTPVILSELTFSDFGYDLLESTEVDSYMKEKMDSNFFDDYDKVYMTDLCVGKDIALEISKSNLKDKFIVFDHHYTNLELNSYDFINVIDEDNGIKECGTSLYYRYLLDNYPNEQILKNSAAYMVSLVRLNDTWLWKEYDVEEARYLTILLNYYGIDYYINNYVDFIKNNKDFYFTKTENILIETENRKIKEYIDNCKKQVIFKTIDGHKVGIVFAELYRSELGNDLAKYYINEVDFIIIINMSRSISYRGVKDSNSLGEFASLYGGKGHKKAAGSPLPVGLKEAIIEFIYGGF